MDLCTNILDNYGNLRQLELKNECFLGQYTVEVPCSLCISAKQLFPIALATFVLLL